MEEKCSTSPGPSDDKAMSHEQGTVPDIQRNSGPYPTNRLQLHERNGNSSSIQNRGESSLRKIEANRRNAQRSTGPKSERGKARVRFNALKHGLLAEQILLSADNEERKQFKQLVEGLWLQFQPVGYLESLDVQEIAVCYWKKRRALRWETRQLQQTSNDFVENQKRTYASIKEKLLEAIDTNSGAGSERQPTRVPKTNVLGEGIPNVDILNAIVRYDAANDRTLHRTLIHLERLQCARRGEYVPAPVSISVEGPLP